MSFSPSCHVAHANVGSFSVWNTSPDLQTNIYSPQVDPTIDSKHPRGGRCYSPARGTSMARESVVRCSCWPKDADR